MEMVLITVLGIVGVAVALIVPTRWGIWSKYDVKPGLVGYKVFQVVHVFGFWQRHVWYGSDDEWYKLGGDAYGTRVSDKRAAWLRLKVQQWEQAVI